MNAMNRSGLYGERGSPHPTLPRITGRGLRKYSLFKGDRGIGLMKQSCHHRVIAIFLITVPFLLTACATTSYVTPNVGVNLDAIDINDYGIRDSFEAQPAAPFPAVIAVTRIQQSGSIAYGNPSHGTGKYSVITSRDIENASDYARITALPQVAGIATLNRLLTPENLKSVKSLREAAASLHADMLLLYTIDSSYRIRGWDLGPLEFFTLGIIPNKKASVTTTASTVLYDVRTGFIYGEAEATYSAGQISTVWNVDQAVDNVRQKTERIAFTKLVDNFCKFWPDVVAKHAGQPNAVSQALP